MKKYFYLVILFFAPMTIHTVFAQNIQTSTIEWTCTSTFTSNPGSVVDEATKVVSSSDQIIWYDNNNVARKTLSITGSTGSWTNVSNNGSITFDVSSGDNTGIVQFSKSNGVTRIRILLIESENAPVYDLTVSTSSSL